jgi:pantoate--beta-alanine ligase
MKIHPSIAEIRADVRTAQYNNQRVALVPTMGALHAGHGTLIRRARAENDIVVVSIFVNPIQFNQAEDLNKYPRPFEADCAYCESLGVDFIFAPTAAEMYPEERLTTISVAKVSAGLCGDFRPGHFDGVATVVAKLFHIIPADRAYFGEKDAQQLAVIRKMVADLNFAIEIVPVETVRESDGLAMSSRNARLDPEARKQAPVIYQALRAAQQQIHSGETDPERVRQAALQLLHGLQVEYLEVVDALTMQPVKRIEHDVRIATAVWLGGVRLIDNVLCRA